MPRGFVGDRHKPGVGARLGQGLDEESAVSADPPRVKDRDSRPREGYGLVEPLASGDPPVGPPGKRLAGADEPWELIDMVDVEGSEVHDPDRFVFSSGRHETPLFLCDPAAQAPRRRGPTPPAFQFAPSAV